jgi:c-di-GMP-binding flagellar brake protein YcgR
MPEPRSVSPSPGKERRREPRTAADRPLVVTVDESPVEVRLRDLSASGLCFFSEKPIPEMTALRIALDLADGKGASQRVQAGGAVVRCQPISPRVAHYEVAVFFHDIDEEARAQLKRFVTDQGR